MIGGLFNPTKARRQQDANAPVHATVKCLVCQFMYWLEFEGQLGISRRLTSGRWAASLLKSMGNAQRLLQAGLGSSETLPVS